MLGVENGGSIQDDWAVWRVVLSGMATLEELDRHWSVDDLILANYALTYQQACQAER